MIVSALNNVGLGWYRLIGTNKATFPATTEFPGNSVEPASRITNPLSRFAGGHGPPDSFKSN